MTGRLITSKHSAYPAQLQAAGRQLGIASQLGEELLQARWIALLKRIGREKATKLLARTQALDAALLQRYENSWDWALLSGNEALPWSLELIERFRDRWNWVVGGLSANESLPWSLELIQRYEHRWNWGGEHGVDDSGLSGNESLPWSLELIERYEDRWGWGNEGVPERSLCSNEALPWSPELLERYADRWNWGEDGFLEPSLSSNEALPWSPELIERYVDRWYWPSLSYNKALPWSLELIERYKDRWSWAFLSENPALPWSLELIERFEDRLDWTGEPFSAGGMSANEVLPWSLELLERFERRWEWGRISENPALPWSHELIERYLVVWNWGGEPFYAGGLSSNEGLPWSLDLIERYADRWDWALLSSNRAVPWSLDLIERYEDRWCWSKLSGNEALPWSLELIERFEDRWDWDGITEILRRAKIVVLSSSAVDELMKHYASSNSDDYAANLEMAEALTPAAGLDWEPLRAAVAACTRCTLHATRTQTVFGVGNRNARCMFIGDAPGTEDDRQGEPFVGRAGELLNSMIHALGLQRADVFITTILKCRPPGNRDPTPEEVLQCRGYLDRQIELVSPTLIVAVGRIATQNLLATDKPIAKLRGKVHAFGSRSTPLIVTYHPAYLLRSPGEKRKAWQDLLLARQILARVEHEGGVAP